MVGSKEVQKYGIYIFSPYFYLEEAGAVNPIYKISDLPIFRGPGAHIYPSLLRQKETEREREKIKRRITNK